jgi:hypothetical protein
VNESESTSAVVLCSIGVCGQVDDADYEECG